MPDLSDVKKKMEKEWKMAGTVVSSQRVYQLPDGTYAIVTMANGFQRHEVKNVKYLPDQEAVESELRPNRIEWHRQ
jgi:hypothetical protein